VLTENKMSIRVVGAYDSTNQTDIQVISASQYYKPKNGVYEIYDIQIVKA
jgi:hypothetical protein